MSCVSFAHVSSCCIGSMQEMIADGRMNERCKAEQTSRAASSMYTWSRMVFFYLENAVTSNMY